ncbi:MAG: mechanosensitive ion channel, partial [Candidatus Auribacterota bacterium]|nr:mechanosensitive ion channel [Candidatus Auribacterota bacterium]
MRKYPAKIIGIIFLTLAAGFCFPVSSPTENGDGTDGAGPGGKKINCSGTPAVQEGKTLAVEFATEVRTEEKIIPESSPKETLTLDEKIEEVKAEAEEAESQVEVTRKEAEIQEKAVEVEKKRADVKQQEAELAKKEVELAGKTHAADGGDREENRKKLRAALKKANQKEEEALLAREQVLLAEEKMSASQAQASLAEEELALAREKIEAVEIQSNKKQRVLYGKLIRTGLVLLIGYLIIFVLIRIINKNIKALKTQHLIRKNVIYILNLIIIIGVILIWLRNISSLTIFISAIGAGVALALQEVILSIAAWIVILIRRPFDVGDRIELGGVKGDVIDIRILQTVLLEIGNWVEADQSTGRIVNVPNSTLFKQPSFNYSRGFEFIWNEIKVLITFESDWERAEEIMLGYALLKAEEKERVVKRKIKQMTRRYMIHYGKLTPIVYINIKDSGVELTLRYLTDARRRRSSADELNRVIL